jgi:hypothetical protein
MVIQFELPNATNLVAAASAATSGLTKDGATACSAASGLAEIRAATSATASGLAKDRAAAGTTTSGLICCNFAVEHVKPPKVGLNFRFGILWIKV